MAAVVLLSQLYNRPVHICHVAKREEVGVAESGCGYLHALFTDPTDQRS